MLSSAEQMGKYRTDSGAGSQQWKPLPKKSFLLESLLEGRVGPLCTSSRVVLPGVMDAEQNPSLLTLEAITRTTPSVTGLGNSHHRLLR